MHDSFITIWRPFLDMTYIIWQLLGTNISREYAAFIFKSQKMAILILVAQIVCLVFYILKMLLLSNSQINMPLFDKDVSYKLLHLQAILIVHC